MHSAPLVKLERIGKSFGSVQVLRGVELSLFPGEIHALMGENGAGKSTLMKVLSGTYPAGAYEGKIRIDGQETSFSSPGEASAAGISIIHQELSAFPDLTVAENFYIGSWPKTGAGTVSWKLIEERAAEWFRSQGITINPRARMGDLSVGNQQLVEISKALSRNSRVLILDEPTSSLSPQETKRLFELARKLKDEGRALVYISHRMEEIFALCDRVTVLRDGQSILTKQIKETKETEIIQAMVGRPLDRLFPEKRLPPPPSSEQALEAVRFTATEKQGARAYGPLSFSLRKGEILGFSGLLGAGRSELLQALLGDGRFQTKGELRFLGKPAHWNEPRQAFQEGIVLVGEDRLRQSILPVRSIEENSAVLRLSLRGLTAKIKPAEEHTRVLEELKKLRTNFHDSANLITQLSGGNQQKTIFSRVLQTRPEVLILDEPTRGVDVGAKFEIYQILLDLVKNGLSVLLVSSDLPELMALSDRVVVLSEGRHTGTLTGNDITESKIMSLAVGRGESA